MAARNKALIQQSGFTLTELMMTLAIGAILTTMAIPAFSTMVEENRITTQIYEFVGQLNYARSTAISKGKQVVLCKSDDGSSCSSNSRWDEGWIIFIDVTHDQQRDNAEFLLRLHGKSDSNLDYKAFGSNNYIAFQPTGILKVGNGTFTFCPDSNEIAPRAVIIAKTGRVRISRTKPNGDPLECPK